MAEGVLVVDGSVNVRQLAEDYVIVLPRGTGYETLAGFMLDRLGTIPKGGESFVFEGRRYTVAELEGRRISKVRIEKLPAPPLRAGGAVGPSPTSAA